MLEKIKKYTLYVLALVTVTVSCQHRTYDSTNNAVPIGINYSYYGSGTGTSVSDGALVINVHSNSYNSYNEYYLVQIYGVGSYTIQSGYTQLFIANVWANSYNFSIEKICTSGNSVNCTARTLTGLATINVETTTVVDAWL